jgi:nucleoside-diphosphate-sugar epimerase
MQKIDSEFWKGKCVFITGHTGFKGSWISLWMQSTGVNLHGLSQNPPKQESQLLVQINGVSIKTLITLCFHMEIMEKYSIT